MVEYSQKVMFRGTFMIIYQSENIGKSYDYKSNSHTNWVVPPHIHEYCEIAFTKQGETCVYIDKERYIVPKNHLIFIQLSSIIDYVCDWLRCAKLLIHPVKLSIKIKGYQVIRSELCLY